MTSSRPLIGRAARWVLMVMLLVGVGLPSGALAQQSLSRQEVQRFKQRVSEGKRLFEMDKFRAAIEQFEAARAIHDHPRLTFNIAQAHKALDQCSAAREAFQRYIDNPDAKPKMRETATELLAELDQTCVETGRLELTCVPQNVQVRLLAIESGEQRSDAGEPLEREGVCPIETELPVGRYRIELSAEGYADRTKEIDIELNSSRVVEVALPREEQAVFAGLDTHSLIAYSAMGVGAAMLVGGLASDYSAVSRLDELSQAQRDGDDGRVGELQREADAASTRTAVLYGVGGALVVGGGIWKWIHSDSGSERTGGARDSRVSIDIGPTGVSGRFAW